MKTITVILLAMIMGYTGNEDSLFDFNVSNIRGGEVSLEEYKGNVIMIVNTASECGFTRQYDDLQKLYEEYSDQGFVILGFPANNFGGQEPGTDEEILEFCEMNFNISFPMFSKVDVKGSDQHALFQYLTEIDNDDFTGDIRWNFEKFLIDRDGQLQRRFRSADNPTGDKIRSSVETLL